MYDDLESNLHFAQEKGLYVSYIKKGNENGSKPFQPLLLCNYVHIFQMHEEITVFSRQWKKIYCSK